MPKKTIKFNYVFKIGMLIKDYNPKIEILSLTQTINLNKSYEESIESRRIELGIKQYLIIYL